MTGMVRAGIEEMMVLLMRALPHCSEDWLAMGRAMSMTVYIKNEANADMFTPNRHGGFHVVGLRETTEGRYRAAAAPVVEMALSQVECEHGWRFAEKDAAWMCDWCISECWERTRRRADYPALMVRTPPKTAMVPALATEEWAVNDGDFSE